MKPLLAAAVLVFAAMPAAAQQSLEAIVLGQGGCLADACPRYEMNVYPDGRYRLHGNNRTRTLGVTEGRFGPDVWPAAVAALDRAKFEALPANVESTLSAPCRTDQPWIRITRRNAGGKGTHVHWYTGCDDARLAALTGELQRLFQFETLVDQTR